MPGTPAGAGHAPREGGPTLAASDGSERGRRPGTFRFFGVRQRRWANSKAVGRPPRYSARCASTTAEVHGSLFDAASGSGGRAAGGGGASATSRGRPRGRAGAPRAGPRAAGAPPARAAAAAPPPGPAAPGPPPPPPPATAREAGGGLG